MLSPACEVSKKWVDGIPPLFRITIGLGVVGEFEKRPPGTAAQLKD
jgi:hypothetical protein